MISLCHLYHLSSQAVGVGSSFVASRQEDGQVRYTGILEAAFAQSGLSHSSPKNEPRIGTVGHFFKYLLQQLETKEYALMRPSLVFALRFFTPLHPFLTLLNSHTLSGFPIHACPSEFALVSFDFLSGERLPPAGLPSVLLQSPLS